MFGRQNFQEAMENKISGLVFATIAGTGDGSYYPLELPPPQRLPDFGRTPCQAHGRNAGQAQGSRSDPPAAKRRPPTPPPPPHRTTEPPHEPRVADLRPAPIGSRQIDPQDQLTPADSFECGILFGCHYMDGALTQDVINNRKKIQFFDQVSYTSYIFVIKGPF